MEKLPYPKSVFFILSSEFCERFCFYGMRTILFIYLRFVLLFPEKVAKQIYHVFIMISYYTALLGSMIADSWWGKFNTIFYVCIVYLTGNLVLTVAATPPLKMPKVELSLLGLILIGLGTGGIKPCVSAFGGDQFLLPDQAIELERFFSFFYFSINLGSFSSMVVTPLLREKVHCFGDTSCFSLAFFVPGVLMAAALVIFVLGKPLYKILEPEGNLIIKVFKCIGHAIKVRRKVPEKKSHWLDYSEEKYGKKLVEDIKVLLAVLVLFVPLPIFWALYDQQGSEWTAQALKMNGDLGLMTILPDQMQVVNPILVLVFIPIFEYVIYPTLRKFNLLTTSLKRLFAGGMLGVMAFVISAFLAIAIEKDDPVMPTSKNGQMRIYNNLDCDMEFVIREPAVGNVKIKSMDYYENVDLKVNKQLNIPYTFTCGSKVGGGDMLILEKKAIGFYSSNADTNTLEAFEDDTVKSLKGSTKIRTLINAKNLVEYKYVTKRGKVILKGDSKDIKVHDVETGVYNFALDDSLVLSDENFDAGGVYVVLVNKNDTYQKAKKLAITKANRVNLLWQIPQYIVMTAAEVMFSVTGLEFSYSQAPASMKCLVQAAWLITIAFGNLCIVLIELANPFTKQHLTCLLYSIILLLDMGVFAILAVKYKYVTPSNEAEEAK